jgi:hypothetical protein
MNDDVSRREGSAVNILFSFSPHLAASRNYGFHTPDLL